MPDNFPDVNSEDTPLYEKYEEDNKDAEGGLEVHTDEYETPVVDTGLDRKVPTTELKDNYVNNSFTFPIGNTYAKGKVIGRKRDADGNYVGRKNNKPILETHKYRVEFDDGEVSKLTANVIE